MNTELRKDLPEEENKKSKKEQLLELLFKFKDGTPEKVILYASLGAAFKEDFPEDEARESTATIYRLLEEYPLDVIFTAVKMLKLDLEKDPPAGLTKTKFRKGTRAELAFLSDFLRQFGISTRVRKKERAAKC